MNDADAIFVVDDDEAVLLSVHAILKQHGYTAAAFRPPPCFSPKRPSIDPAA